MQRLFLRLDVVTGHHLAEMCYIQYPKLPRMIRWLMMEVAIIGADMQEVIGTAIALYFLSNTLIPLWLGVVLTVIDTFLFLLLDRFGLRKLEIFFGLLVATMVFTFGYELWVAKPDGAEMAKGLIYPLCEGCDRSVALQAIGIVGATITPHNLYLHSGMVKNNTEIVQLDIYKSGIFLGCQYGVAAMYIWGVGVLAAGEGATMMCHLPGFLHLKWVRWRRVLFTRSLAILPTFLVAFYSTLPELSGLNDILNAMFSIQIPFAILPLVAFTSNATIMGQFANGLCAKILIPLVTGGLIIINVYFVWSSVVTQMSDNRLLLVLFIYAVVYVSMCIYLVAHMVANMASRHPISQRLLKNTSWTNEEMRLLTDGYECQKCDSRNVTED